MSAHTHDLPPRGSTRGWRQRLDEAERFVRRARAARGARRRSLTVKAAKILVDVVHNGEPARHRREFQKIEWRVEVAVGKLVGCAGCLAEEMTPGEKHTIAKMHRQRNTWFPVCAACLRAALRPKVDGSTEIDEDVRERCYICHVRRASHEYTPNLWPTLARAMRGPFIPGEVMWENLGHVPETRALEVMASLAPEPSAVVSIGNLRLAFPRASRSSLDTTLRRLSREGSLVRVHGGAQLGRGLAAVVASIK